MIGPVNDNLLDEAMRLARNDGNLVRSFQDGTLQLEEVVRLVSRDVYSCHKRRLFDELFYEQQLCALQEKLEDCSEFQSSWGGNRMKEK